MMFGSDAHGLPPLGFVEQGAETDGSDEAKDRIFAGQGEMRCAACDDLQAEPTAGGKEVVFPPHPDPLPRWGEGVIRARPDDFQPEARAERVTQLFRQRWIID